MISFRYVAHKDGVPGTGREKGGGGPHLKGKKRNRLLDEIGSLKWHQHPSYISAFARLLPRVCSSAGRGDKPELLCGSIHHLIEGRSGTRQGAPLYAEIRGLISFIVIIARCRVLHRFEAPVCHRRGATNSCLQPSRGPSRKGPAMGAAAEGTVRKKGHTRGAYRNGLQWPSRQRGGAGLHYEHAVHNGAGLSSVCSLGVYDRSGASLLADQRYGPLRPLSQTSCDGMILRSFTEDTKAECPDSIKLESYMDRRTCLIWLFQETVRC